MMFKNSFKYYKRRNPSPDFKDVIDLNKPNCSRVIPFKRNLLNVSADHKLGLKPVNDWEVYEFLEIPGLIFIKNPFTNYGQRYWIIQCIKHYSRKPYKINLDAHNVLDNDKTWWDTCFGQSDQVSKLIPKLRWATLGYIYDWDTKLYSETRKTKMPTELTALTSVVAQTLGFMNFKAEAAIVNYYRMNSILNGHTDHSEINTEAPLFSISFGQSAIFLMGGLTEDDAANAMYLRSGDIVIMSGNSRLKYHGVPKILPADTTPWDDEEANDCSECCTWDENDWNKARTYISQARININVRQVLKPGQLTLP